jgi:formylglycine-generating enzyme
MQAARAVQASAVALLAIALTPACTKAVASTDPVGNATVQIATVPGSMPAPVEKNKKKVDPDANACPEGMVLVEGEYCPDVEQKCLEWMDPPSSRYHEFRCARYEKPAKCKGPKVHKRYCIDATERTETDGSNLPRHFMSWTSSKKLCEAEGARLCLESEWIFACEGEEMRPYPYGWERDSAACNVDRSENIGRPGRLVDHRDAAGSHAKCASPFGVQDLAGNVEEWVQADNGKKMGWKEVLKGSWWIPSRHACRQFQVGHNDVYNGAETGTRCCKDAPTREVAAN